MIVNSRLSASRTSAPGIALIGVVVVVLGACRTDAPPAGPSDPRNGCAVGPFPVLTSGPEPCPGLGSRCPQPRPQDAKALIWVLSCMYREGQPGCEPSAPMVPGCPRDAYAPFMTLVNPNRDELHPCFSGGDMRVVIAATATGGATVQWSAHERDAVSCSFVGPEITGSDVVTGPCCERMIDVRFPAGKFFVRMVVRTDWQP